MNSRDFAVLACLGLHFFFQDGSAIDLSLAKPLVSPRQSPYKSASVASSKIMDAAYSLALVQSASSTQNVSCYHCATSSGDDVDGVSCNPFNPNTANVMDNCIACGKMEASGTLFGISLDSVSRACLTSSDDFPGTVTEGTASCMEMPEVLGLKSTTCVCYSELCNSANMYKGSFLLFILTIVITLMNA